MELRKPWSGANMACVGGGGDGRGVRSGLSEMDRVYRLWEWGGWSSSLHFHVGPYRVLPATPECPGLAVHSLLLPHFPSRLEQKLPVL